MYRNLEIHYHVHNSVPLVPNLIYIGCPESRYKCNKTILKYLTKSSEKTLFLTHTFSYLST
jgi:hypothetical protein